MKDYSKDFSAPLIEEDCWCRQSYCEHYVAGGIYVSICKIHPPEIQFLDGGICIPWVYEKLERIKELENYVLYLQSLLSKKKGEE